MLHRTMSSVHGAKEDKSNSTGKIGYGEISRNINTKRTRCFSVHGGPVWPECCRLPGGDPRTLDRNLEALPGFAERRSQDLLDLVAVLARGRPPDPRQEPRGASRLR